MTNSKWLRSALLGGVAVSVMATGAQASDLSDLKAQLEALQSRVNTIETAPALPAGTSAITVRSGQSTDQRLMSMGSAAKELADPADRGFTFAVTPTADLPAPTTEITISGHVRSYFQWNNEDVAGFAVDDAVDGTESHMRLVAIGRLTVRAKTDTAIGQIRALIEVEATDGGAVGQRHALGEWDMTPNWTFQMGRTWSTSGPLSYGVTTISGSAYGGPDIYRTEMIRLRYTNGPLRFMVAIEDPTDPVATNNADYPNFAGHIQYTASGGHELWAGAEIADYGTRAGYYLNGGANIKLGDIASLTSTVTYGRGLPGDTRFGQVNTASFDAAGKPTRALGAGVGVSFSVSEATTANVAYGFARMYNQAAATDTRYSHTVHANILWRPVKQMRLGWEARWGKEKQTNGVKNDVFGVAFGSWFFF